MKKNYFFIILFVLNFYAYTEHISDYLKKLEGTWYSEQDIVKHNTVYKHALGYKNFESKKYKNLGYDTLLIISPDEKNKNGLFWFLGQTVNAIVDAQFDGNETLILTITYVDRKSTDELVPDFDSKDKVQIQFITNNEIRLLNWKWNEKDKKIWYKIDGPAVIPEKKAKCNDSKVRLRLKPNLTCQTLGYLNKDDSVLIKDRSEEKFEIDGESWYWYKVDYPTLPDGWVYGKYLDIEE